MIPGLKCREWITTTGDRARENKSFEKREETGDWAAERMGERSQSI